MSQTTMNINTSLDNFVELNRLTLKQMKISKRIMEEELRLYNFKLSAVALMRYLTLYREFWKEQQHITPYMQRFINTVNYLIPLVSKLCADYEKQSEDLQFMSSLRDALYRVFFNWETAQTDFNHIINTEDNDSTIHYKYAMPKYIAWIAKIANQLVTSVMWIKTPTELGESNLRNELYTAYAHFTKVYDRTHSECYIR